MHDLYDIAIVGCGPAGTTAAKYASRGDKCIILFEKGENPESSCTGGLTIPALMRTRWTPPREIIQQSFTTIKIHSKNYTTTITSEDLDLSVLGVVIDRRKFDQYLLKKIKDDVELCTNTQVVSLEKTDRWTLYTSKDTYRAKTVILCNGTASYLPPQSPLMAQDKAVGIEDRVKGSHDVLDLYLEKKFTDVGYAWIFPAGNMVKIGLGETEPEGKNLRNKLEKFKRDTSFDKPIQESISGIIPLSRPMSSLSLGGDLALAGDAGRLCNPLTGEGIANAIFSGRILGETLARGDPLERYDERMEDLKRELDNSYLIKRILYGLDDSDLDKINKIIDSSDIKKILLHKTLIKPIVKSIIRHPDLLFKMALEWIH